MVESRTGIIGELKTGVSRCERKLAGIFSSTQIFIGSGRVLEVE